VKDASVTTTTAEDLPAFDTTAPFLSGTHVAILTSAPSSTLKEDVVETPYISYGRANFHGPKSRTASGESANAGDLTAAHPSLPIGTRVRLTNLFTGKIRDGPDQPWSARSRRNC
jgi:rare lipoprotein A